MIVVSDATPLNVLVQLGLIDALAKLYGTVYAPPAVIAELDAQNTPQSVRDWLDSEPPWLYVRAPAKPVCGPLAGKGEREALALAKELGADRFLADDGDARKKARSEGIQPIGTIGLLEEFGARGWCDLRETFGRLPANFRIDQAILNNSLRRFDEATRDRTTKMPEHEPEIDL